MLVIFDCDGVLVDSETLASDVFSNCLHAHDIQMTPFECFEQFRGHSLDYCKQWLQKKYAHLPENFFDLLEIETQKAFDVSLKAVEGVEAVIQNLNARNIPICVASNGSHKKIEHSLHVCGLLKYFSGNRFSREDVCRGKPAPDLFLFAAEVMGVPPEFVVVVEDSLAGMRAALDAGMMVYGYQPQLSRLSNKNTDSEIADDKHATLKGEALNGVRQFATMDELAVQLLNRAISV